MFDDKGLSLIYLHTDKGRRLLDELSSKIEYKQVESKLVEEQIASEVGYYSEGSGAREFYFLFNFLPLSYIAKKARRKGVVKKCQNKLKKIRKFICQRKK